MKEFIVKKTPHKPLIQDVEEYMSKVDHLEANKVGTTEFEDVIGALDNSVATNKNSINTLNSNMTSVNSDMTSVKSRLGNVETSVDDLDSSISAVESRISESEISISQLDQKLSTFSADMMIPITYSKLKSLRDNSELVPGMFYRITDYQCTTTQENTRAMNNQFDIIVQALSKNTLSENASADYHVGEEAKMVPVFMDSVLTNKKISSKVIIYYTEFTDDGTLQENYREGGHTEDLMVEWGYKENGDGDVVPVLYKTDLQGVDPTRPGYNSEFAETDYGDVFYYIGTEEIDGVIYDKWRKTDEEYTWDADSKIYVYTNAIVQDGSINFESESLIIETEGELRLDCTKITNVYREYVDFSADGTFNYELHAADEFIFAAHDYLENNEGDIVPVLYDWYEDNIPKNDKFFYVGKATIDGVVYDKWRKIDDSNSNYDWDAEGKIYFYTNEIVNIINNGGDKANDTYFADCNLTAWEIKYCLDNDTTRFAWADEGNGTGVIYYMKDEYNNECPYDFKNIQFKRLVSLENGYPEHDPENGEETWIYTFCGNSYHMDNDEWSELLDGSLESSYGHESDELSSTFQHNIIRPYIMLFDYENEDHTKCGKMYLNNNVFFGYWNKIGSSNEESLYSAYCCYSNTLDNNCYSNTFGNNCHSNTLGSNCHSNTLGSNCNSNTLDNNCYSNTFGNSCFYNIFGNQCSDNIFGNSCYSNIFGNQCSDNIFDNYCYSNTFGNNCNSNAFGDSCQHNSFGSYCHSNIFGNSCFHNIFGIRCCDNIFGENDNLLSYIKYVKFADGCQYIKLLNTETVGWENYIQNITVSSGVGGTKSAPRELQVSRNAPPVIFEAADTTHIILD